MMPTPPGCAFAAPCAASVTIARWCQGCLVGEVMRLRAVVQAGEALAEAMQAWYDIDLDPPLSPREQTAIDALAAWVAAQETSYE